MELLLFKNAASITISKNDQFSDVMEKVRPYLRDGVRVVWVFDPPAQTVTIFAQGS